MDNKDILPRIGTFFIIMGIGAVVLFIISDIAKAVSFTYLFVGLLLVGIGIAARRNVEKEEASGRFAILKKTRDKDKKKTD